MSTWTFGRKIAAGFAVASVVLLVIALVGYRTTTRLIDNQDLVAHTQEVRAELARLLSQMKDVESGARGYVIAGQDEFLEPYRAALPRIEASYAHLRALTADNAVQQRRLDIGIYKGDDAKVRVVVKIRQAPESAFLLGIQRRLRMTTKQVVALLAEM